jgi:hypothetical protein
LSNPHLFSAAQQPVLAEWYNVVGMPTYERDVFLSHRNTDKAWARQLAARIESVHVGGRQLTVWLDEAEVRPGRSVVAEVNRGLERSRFIALVMTPDYFDSPSGWTDAEWQAALYTDPAGRQGRVVPLLAKHNRAEYYAFL